MLKIIQIPVLSDNYVYILHDEASKTTAVVDPALALDVQQTLEQYGWNLDVILNTHHHPDHVGGNLELKTRYRCQIIGPKADESRIPGIDHVVADGDLLEFGNFKFEVFDVPGHTRGHIAYLIEDALFCGDTLFSLGCGRLFEGTPEQMVGSLTKFLALPDNTRIFCAHEYTLANAKFTESYAAENGLTKYSEEFQSQLRKIEEIRQRNLPTVPSTIGFEKQWNLFLRACVADHEINPRNLEPNELFAQVRSAKDHF